MTTWVRKNWPGVWAYLLIGGLLLVACASPRRAGGRYVEEGIASWYGPKFHGRRTASGEIFDMYKLTAAHPWLPFGTVVRVTNLENGLSVVVRINDRGPFVKGRIIDLSYAAAKKIRMLRQNARVRVEVLRWPKRR